ncbi:hypothetical protein ACTXT7_013912 [Hymenolepis weldensis]
MIPSAFIINLVFNLIIPASGYATRTRAVNGSARVEGEEPHDFSEDAKKAQSTDPLFAWAPASGECYVTCFHPRPDLTLALMNLEDIVKVVEEWARLTHQCSGRGFQWVQIFENRGEIMGCSNPHPHCQTWASDFIPTRALRSDHGQQDYFNQQKRPLLLDYVNRELAAKERIVVSNSDWVILVPWWASWPFESMVLPRKRHVGRLDELSPEERSSLANIMSQILIAYDNLFETSFPYSFGWYQTPLQRSEKAAYWQLHGIYLPPLLRSATVKKYMVGYELLAEVQRDLAPEKAADLLRQAAVKEHYLKRQTNDTVKLLEYEDGNESRQNYMPRSTPKPPRPTMQDSRCVRISHEMKIYAVMVSFKTKHGNLEITRFLKVATSFACKVRKALNNKNGDELASMRKRKQHCQRSADSLRTPEL